MAALAAVAQPATAAQAPGPPLTTPQNVQGDRGAPVMTNGAARAAPASGAGVAPAPAPPSATAAGAAGVTSYPAAFFAASQPNTALDMINRTPGFSLVTGGGSRGFSDAGNALIDGARPSSKNDDLGSILQRLPASQVERIDVIRGGAPGIDMQGLAVVANVVRRKGAASTGLIGVADTWVVSDGRHAPIVRLEGSRRWDGRTLEASYVGSSFTDDGAGDGSRTRRDAAGRVIDAARDKSEADGMEHTLSSSFETPLAGGKLRVNGQALVQKYFYDDVLNPLIGAPPGSSQSRERDHQNKEELELGGDYTRQFGARLKSETVVLQNVKGEDYLTLFTAPGDLERFREQHTQTETVGRQTLTWTASRRLAVEGGAEFAYNDLTSHVRFVQNGAAMAIPGANVEVREFRGEAFAKATWTATSKLTVEAGLRLEVSDIASGGDVVLGKTLVYPKPRLQITWSPTKADQIRLRAEEEVGQLDFGDFVAASSLSTGQILAGNPDLVPQQATVLEAAYERTFWGSGDVTLTFRHSQIADVADRAPIFSPNGVFDAPANIGDGRKEELILNASIPLDKLGIKGGLLKPSATVRDSEVTDPTTGAARPISGLRPFEGELDFSQDLPRWHAKWGGFVFGGFQQRYYRFNQVETDTFHPLYGLFVQWKPKPDLDLKLQVDHVATRYDRRLTAYDGVRGVDPVAFSERRPLRLGPYVQFRVRKTF